MHYINFKELALREIESNNINIDDIVSVTSVQTISEGTMAPKLNFIFKMIDDTERSTSTPLTREFIEDLKAGNITVEGDMEKLNKFFKRKINLQQLLRDE